MDFACLSVPENLPFQISRQTSPAAWRQRMEYVSPLVCQHDRKVIIFRAPAKETRLSVDSRAEKCICRDSFLPQVGCWRVGGVGEGVFPFSVLFLLRLASLKKESIDRYWPRPHIHYLSASMEERQKKLPSQSTKEWQLGSNISASPDRAETWHYGVQSIFGASTLAQDLSREE